VVPISRPESTCSSGDDADLPSLANFLSPPPTRGNKLASWRKDVAADSEADSEELETVSRTSSSST